MADSVLFTARGLDALEDALTASPSDVRRAERRALRRTITWVRKQMLREGAQEFRVPQARLKKANRASISTADHGARSWLGIDPIRAGYLGKPRQQKRGARVGKHTFPGAFVASMASGYTGIFTRRDAAASATGVDSKGRPRKGRLPLEEQVVKAENGISDSFMQWLAANADQRLLKEFVQNLEFYSGARG